MCPGGWNAVHLASRHKGILSLLLASGGDVNIATRINGRVKIVLLETATQNSQTKFNRNQAILRSTLLLLTGRDLACAYVWNTAPITAPGTLWDIHPGT
jgi:hypothetical protein